MGVPQFTTVVSILSHDLKLGGFSPMTWEARSWGRHIFCGCGSRSRTQNDPLVVKRGWLENPRTTRRLTVNGKIHINGGFSNAKFESRRVYYFWTGIYIYTHVRAWWKFWSPTQLFGSQFQGVKVLVHVGSSVLTMCRPLELQVIAIPMTITFIYTHIFI